MAHASHGIAFVNFADLPADLDKLSVKIIGIGPAGKAVRPTAETIMDGSYPLSRRMHLYVSPKAGKVTKDFVKFVLSGVCGKTFVKHGLVPAKAQSLATQLREPWQDNMATFIEVFRKATIEYQKANNGPVNLAEIGRPFVGKTIRWTGELKYVHKSRPYFRNAFVKVDDRTSVSIAEFISGKSAEWKKFKPGDMVTFTGKIGESGGPSSPW